MPSVLSGQVFNYEKARGLSQCKGIKPILTASSPLISQYEKIVLFFLNKCKDIDLQPGRQSAELNHEATASAIFVPLVAIRIKVKKMLTFQANAVSAQYDENEVLIIGFADLQENGKPNHYFMIQHTDEYDEQDVKLGMNAYYLERDDQGYSTYGGIEKINLSSSQICIDLNKLGQQHLAVRRVTIGLVLTAEKYKHLMQQLKKIFDEKKLHIDL